MSSTNKTPNLGLCQWEATDPFLREDMNGDFAKIDEAIGGMSRVKLFDVTIGETTQIVSLDFSEIDMDQFAELEIHIDTATALWYARVNGISSNVYTINNAGLSGSSSQNSMLCVYSGTNHMSITRHSICVSPSRVLNTCVLPREHCPEFASLEIYASGSSYSFKPGEQITVWGVKK